MPKPKRLEDERAKSRKRRIGNAVFAILSPIFYGIQEWSEQPILFSRAWVDGSDLSRRTCIKPLAKGLLPYEKRERVRAPVHDNQIGFSIRIEIFGRGRHRIPPGEAE